jgi:hypothetical protein
VKDIDEGRRGPGGLGRRRRAQRLLALVAFVVALAVAGCSGAPSPPSASSVRPSATRTQQNAADPDVARESALTDLLRARAKAVLAHDRKAFAATLDNPASGFGLRQLAAFDALTALPLATFSYGTPEPAPALGAARAAQVGPDAWVSRVNGRYSLAGYDTAQRDYDTYFTVVRRGTGWKLADDTDGGTQPQLWDLPRLSVLRTRAVLVVGTGPAGRLRRYLTLGEVAVRQVRDVWTPRWKGRLVLVVPSTAREMAGQAGQQVGQVAQVAAITDGPFDPQGRAGADRVIVNPEAFARLQERGQQVVLSHEATHVAIRATTDRPVPLWLSEGMADYVGYRLAGATRQQVAAALVERVRAGKGPTALPTASDFDPAHATIAPSYNAAWLAVSRIADLYGRSALVRFYLAVATSPTPGAPPGDADANTSRAFGSVLHTTEAQFTREWLAYVRTLAASPS